MRPKLLALTLVLAGGVGLTACSAQTAGGDGETIPSWADTFSACMTQAGWSVSIRSDGGVESEYPESQRAVYEAQASLCADQAGSGAIPTEEEFGLGYEGLLDDHQCIVNEGYTLPQPPSYQSWREMDGLWNPFMDVPLDLTEDQLQALIDRCTPTGI